MKVIVAKSAGFCWGVKRAVETARTVRQKEGAPVYTDGPLIHNEQMMEQLRREGILETEEPTTLDRGALLIRAHGIAPDRRKRLAQLPVRLYDVTCRDVARIQGLIRKHASKGYHTVIFGDPGHAEVVGLLGFTDGRGHVVAKEADVDALPEMNPVCLVAQSTQFPEHYQRIADCVRRRFPDTIILDTICEATKQRQTELVAMSMTVDAFVIIGGQHSANTVRLVELARSFKPTYHIQTARQLPLDELKRHGCLGLSAGASTPDFVIEEVRRVLESL